MMPVENVEKCEPEELLKLKSCVAARFLDAYGMWLRDADGNHVPFDWTSEGPYYVQQRILPERGSLPGTRVADRMGVLDLLSPSKAGLTPAARTWQIAEKA